MTVNKYRFSLTAVWLSFRSLPVWVQIWVGCILVPVNAASFFLTHTWTGTAAAIAAVFVVLTNIPIMLYEGGMSRLMSVPHLFAWIPLTFFIVLHLLNPTDEAAIDTVELIFAILLLIVNGISLIFDSIDTIRWCRGEREIPGHH